MMSPPVSVDLYNPLGAKRGDFMALDVVSPAAVVTRCAGLMFTIDERAEYRRQLNGREFLFADYVLRDGDAWVTVRVVPKEHAAEFERDRWECLVLLPDHEMPYDEPFHKAVLPVGTLELRDRDRIAATYQCLNGRSEPYRAEVRSIGPLGFEAETVDYWSFGREIEGSTEFYFVEMNTGNGFFRMWKGYPIPTRIVSVIPRGQ